MAPDSICEQCDEYATHDLRKQILLPLSAGAWVECLGLAMIVLVASELRKCVLRAMHRR